MNSIASLRKRQLLGYLAFVVAALVTLGFWAFELHLAMASHDEREEEVLAAHQHQLLGTRAEAFRDIFHEIYQTGRTISLLPSIRGADGRNRSSEDEDVVAQGRLSIDADRTLQQIYANLASNVRVSEVYYVKDGFDPAKGEVPFFMYDDLVAKPGATRSQVSGSDTPAEDETEEYDVIRRQLDWFRSNAPRFDYASDLNAIPALVSPPVRTCDNTQYASLAKGSVRDAQGIVFSIPAYDAVTGNFKGQVSIILRTNVLEALLIDVPFVPVTEEDHGLVKAAGWKMPAPSHFVLVEKTGSTEVTDRRNRVLGTGLVAARANPATGGRWASLRVNVPGNSQWELHHYLTQAEIGQLVRGIRSSKQLSIAGRLALLAVLAAVLAGGGWLIRSSRRELVRMAHVDQLTGLPNRRLFFDRLEKGITRAQRSGRRLGLFFLDLADLNAINDRHGHQGGDQLLIEVSNRLQQSLRSTDSIARGAHSPEGAGESLLPASAKFLLSRLGGDEFTVLCEDLQAQDDLIIVAERIVECMAERFTLGSESIEIGVNVGAALFPDDAVDAERLLMSADSAMHECKAVAAPYVLFNEDMRKRAERQHLMVLELAQALRRRQFELFYQPKAMIADGRVTSLEALIRWRHPSLGLVSPLDFIPLCERNGSIIEIGQWIVEQACRDLQRLAQTGHPQIKLSVNVSVRQLRHAGFFDFLERTLRETGTDAARLVLEVTESMVMEDLAKGRDALQRLKDLGVSVALDDFGAGYSSMTYLQHLPLDSLKIDKSLVDGMTDERSIHVVRTVIRLAQGLSLKTIAEGVETVEQQDLLGRLGCDMIQGYLLSRPAPLPTILEWISVRQGGMRRSTADSIADT